MEPWDSWFKLARDALIAVLGAAVIVWQCILVAHPNPLAVGAGLTLLGLPTAVRLDLGLSSRRRTTDAPRRPQGDDREEDI